MLRGNIRSDGRQPEIRDHCGPKTAFFCPEFPSGDTHLFVKKFDKEFPRQIINRHPYGRDRQGVSQLNGEHVEHARQGHPAWNQE